MKKERVYVCHTYYHAYIAVIKELNLPKEERGKATLVLSTMSNDFGNLIDRAKASGLFEEVHMFEEQEDVKSEEVMKYHQDRGNTVLNLLQRIKYTKLLGKLQEKYVPVDFSQYKNIYVFCDSDPIGYYLSYKRLKYHAVEDGLDCISTYDTARFSNRGHFGLKAWMAKHNLIFIENGYAKYCIDMEVNNIACLPYPIKKYKEVPRATLIGNVAEEDKLTILKIFMEDVDGLMAQIEARDKSKPTMMLLTEPLCDLETRKRIFTDLIDEYGNGYTVFIKPHPRDELDYGEMFHDGIVLKGRFPMEVMNDIPGMEIDRLVSVFTVIDSIKFAKEIVYLGEDFMDKYEAPELHRQNELI